MKYIYFKKSIESEQTHRFVVLNILGFYRVNGYIRKDAGIIKKRNATLQKGL